MTERLGIFLDDVGREQKPTFPEDHGTWEMDATDYLLYALLCDPITCAELLCENPLNREYGGAYTVWDYQYELNRDSSNYEGKTCGRSVGKALADGSPVLTPDGYRPIESLRPGDMAIGSQGLPVEVLGVYPQGERDLYRVQFSDGAAVECDADHLWTVTCDGWQSRGTGEQTLRLGAILERAAKFKVRLPSAPVIFRPRPEPPIDPWLVGALLGDGNLTRPTMIRFASVDGENIGRFRAALPGDAELTHDAGCDYRVRSREYVLCRPGQRSPGRAACKLLQWSREEGLQGLAAHEKHVPRAYLWGSVETRLAVLRGLADTDGSACSAGSVEICSASPQLADDIRHLALSLGGRASIRTGPTPCRDRHRVLFRLPDLNPFLLSRKADAYVRNNAKRTRDCDWRSIVAITPVERGHATCIEVASDDGLFMAADMVLTHNTESIRNKAMAHGFKRMGQGLLLTAPELIHLLPLTDAIEDRIAACRLTREFLDTDRGHTGFTHRPFGVDYLDGTKIIGRIPRLSGTGVKGAHVPDLIVDEAQNYPEAGWTEVHEVVMKDTVDRDGNPDFSYVFYGVHSGERDTGFHRRASSGGFHIVQVTALQRPGWGAGEKEAAKAAYGGTSAPDYRRNILGEPGAASSPLFVTARLIAAMDQDRQSDYNLRDYQYQEIRAEQFDELMLPIADVLDLPSGLKRVWAGADLGLTNSPTVFTLWNEHTVDGEARLSLFRRIHLERMRVKTIRFAIYAMFSHFGEALQGFGMDETGLGFPIFQEIEDDEGKPAGMADRFRGYFFNSKVPVGVEKGLLTQDSAGNWRDQYGAAVDVRQNALTNEDEYVVRMPMIEASTRYLREFVDTGFLRLPFDPAVIGDMQGDSQQRVKRIAGLKQKPNAFHVLDSMRAMAMVFKSASVEAQLAEPEQQPVLDIAL